MSESQKAFEIWFRREQPGASLEVAHGEYVGAKALLAWQAWQAACRFADGV